LEKTEKKEKHKRLCKKGKGETKTVKMAAKKVVGESGLRKPTVRRDEKRRRLQTKENTKRI